VSHLQRSTTADGIITEKIFSSLDKKLPEFDMGFSSLIRDLDERGPAKTTHWSPVSENLDEVQE
jgi:hypothetical protein